MKIESTFLTEKPIILKSPNAHNPIDRSKLVPKTSSIENAIFSLYFVSNVIEFENIL